MKAIRIEDAGDRVGRAESGDVRRERDPPSVLQNDGAFGEFLDSILVALDVNVGAQAFEHELGGSFTESNDRIDAAQPEQDPRAVGKRHDRPALRL